MHVAVSEASYVGEIELAWGIKCKTHSIQFILRIPVISIRTQSQLSLYRSFFCFFFHGLHGMDWATWHWSFIYMTTSTWIPNTIYCVLKYILSYIKCMIAWKTFKTLHCCSEYQSYLQYMFEFCILCTSYWSYGLPPGLMMI